MLQKGKKLFDIKIDANNDYDLAQSNPELVQTLIEKIERWKNDRKISNH